ncbi:MAG TPA: 7-cyano-7-deazaguanine synthase [bacterium]|nr:7-cyano-7-deazaguanine synthase [bacterium]
MKKGKIAVLASGGIDSNVLLAELARRGHAIYPVYTRFGLIWEKAELHWLKRYLRALPPKLRRRIRPLTILNQPVCDLYRNGWALTGRGTPGYRSDDRKVYLPGRNLLFLSKAAPFCVLRGIRAIAVGTLVSNPFPDASKAFFQSFERSASIALKSPFKILTPFSGLKKRQVIRKGRGLPLHLSFSCLAPRGYKVCGRCNKCAEREKSFS